MKSSLYAILTACFLFVSLHLLGAVPPVPALLPATNVAHDSFTANWNQVSDADSYELELWQGQVSNQLTEGFEGSQSFPAGWVLSDPAPGINWTAAYAHTGSHCATLSASNRYFYPPSIDNPKNISFWARALADNSVFTLKVQSSSDANIWTDLETLSASSGNSGSITTTYTNYIIRTGLSGPTFIRFYLSARTAGAALIDDIQIYGGIGAPVPSYAPLSTPSTSALLSGLASETLYSYSVKAVNQDGASAFSDWLSVQTTEQTLPVQLTSFTAAQINLDFVRLRWATESETNLLGYHILRGENSEPLSARIISPLIPAGNSSQPKQYSFDDHDLTTPGTYYYWLEVAEITGSSETFGPVVQHYNPNTEEPHSPPVMSGFTMIHPNPFSSSVLLKFSTPTTSTVGLSIYNIRGQRVREFEFPGVPGAEHALQWDGLDSQGDSCPSGVYWAVLQIGETKHIRKLTLSK